MAAVPIKDAVTGPFWAKKFLSVLRKMNVAGDGVIKRSDYEGLGERYVEIGNLDGVRAKQVKRKLVKLWEDYFSRDATEEGIKEQDCLRSLEKNKDRLLESCLELFGLLFDLIDLNGDGVIQRDEYSLFLKVFRVEDEQDIKRAFEAIDTDGSGEISHDEFIYAGCKYFMTNDESLPETYIFGRLV